MGIGLVPISRIKVIPAYLQGKGQNIDKALIKKIRAAIPTEGYGDDVMVILSVDYLYPESSYYILVAGYETYEAVRLSKIKKIHVMVVGIEQHM